MTVEILVLVWNRWEFTETMLTLLRENTDWERVSRLIIYDDGSEDGADGVARKLGETMPVPAFDFRRVHYRSPGATINDYVALTEAEAFVKLDSDIAVPKDWLGPLIQVAEDNPQAELIGAEAGWTGSFPKRRPEQYGITWAQHIGGVGLFRTEAFERRKPISSSQGRLGFTLWQHRRGVRTGWITPDLAMVQLDRVPAPPWNALAAKYVSRGWARSWAPHEPCDNAWWSHVPRRRRAA